MLEYSSREVLNMSDWKSKLSAEALEKKRKRNRAYTQAYKKAHRAEINAKTKQLSVDIYLPREQNYLDLWRTIPSKKQFIIDALDRYEEEHKNE